MVNSSVVGSSDYSFKEVWSNSVAVKLSVISSILFFLGFGIFIIIYAITSSDQASQIADLQDSYSNCSSTRYQQSMEIAVLRDQVSNLTAQNADLNTRVTNLTAANEALKKQVGSCAVELASLKGVMLYWQIGAGVGGGLTLGTGGYAYYAISQESKMLTACNGYLYSNRTKLQAAERTINSLTDRSKSLMPSVVSDRILAKKSTIKLDTTYMCYNSHEQNFNRTAFMLNCSDGANSTLITFKTSKSRFGAYFDKPLPQDTGSLYDVKSFVYIMDNFTFGDIRSNYEVFRFGTGTEMLRIGYNEIIVSENTTHISQVTTIPGNYYNINSTNSYADTNNFIVEEMLAFKVIPVALSEEEKQNINYDGIY